MTLGEQRLCEWQYGGGGSFSTKLFDLISIADGPNQARLALAFPEETEAYFKFSSVDGYWDALEAEWLRAGRIPAVAR